MLKWEYSTPVSVSPLQVYQLISGKQTDARVDKQAKMLGLYACVGEHVHEFIYLSCIIHVDVSVCVCMCDNQEVLAALEARMHDNDCSDKRDHGCVEGKWNMKNKTNRRRNVWRVELMAPLFAERNMSVSKCVF